MKGSLMFKTHLPNKITPLILLLSVTYKCNAEHIANNDEKHLPLPIKAGEDYRQENYNTAMPMHDWLFYALPQLNSFIITDKSKNKTKPTIELSDSIKNGREEIKSMVTHLKISEGNWEISSLFNMDIYRYK